MNTSQRIYMLDLHAGSPCTEQRGEIIGRRACVEVVDAETRGHPHGAVARRLRVTDEVAGAVLRQAQHLARVDVPGHARWREAPAWRRARWRRTPNWSYSNSSSAPSAPPPATGAPAAHEAEAPRHRNRTWKLRPEAVSLSVGSPARARGPTVPSAGAGGAVRRRAARLQRHGMPEPTRRRGARETAGR